MALLRWDPWGEVAALQRDVNELFSRSTGPGAAGVVPRAGMYLPPIDAFTTDEGLIVRMELPGMKPEDVDISVQDSVLTVAGERFAETDVKDDAWLRRERFTGTFERSFTLPEGVDADSITAGFDNGVLELRIPHPPEQQPRRVKIEAGAGQHALDANTD
jgi:HSP20 family protein